jgi:uncharacterized delta-60 repeat protein
MKTFMRIALASVLGSTAAAACAADGDIDTSFGTGGLALTGLTDASGASACAPLVQPDGKIVTCATRLLNGSSGSDFLVARFNADGTPDTSFSFDGQLTIDFDNGAGSDLASALALQADGKIIVVGSTKASTAPGTGDFAIARLDADGSLDTTFGAGTGKTTVAFDLNAGAGNDTAASVALQADGKIVVAGSAEIAGGAVFALTRLLSDGTRDSAFNLNGKVTFGFGISGPAAESDSATAVAIDQNGRMVVSGTAGYNDGTNQISRFAVARLLANGSPDSNFHANGQTTIAFDPGNGLSAALGLGLMIQRDGRIVVCGAANSSTSATPNNDIAIARLQPDGSLDSGFGFAGRTQIAFDLAPNGTDVGFGVVEQSNGRLLVAGASLGTSPPEVGTVIRLRADGTLDEGFGTVGKRTYNFSTGTPNEQAFTGIAFQGTQIIVAGLVLVPGGGSTIDSVVLRLTNDLIFADGFE